MRRGLCLLAAALLASCSPSGDESTAVETRLDYPDARPVEQVDVYHGVEVADPYRWLEDLSSLETEAFVSAQDSLTRAYLSSKPEREILRRRLVALNDYDVYRLPQRAGDRYFFIHRQGLEDQPILHMSRSLSGPSEILVDPNRLSADGTVSLHYFEPSTDGRRVLYTLSTAGSDWREVRVVDVESRRELDDRIRGIHTFSSLAWSHDGDGIYYGRPPTPASVGGPDLALDHSTVFFHRIGDDQAQDRIVYERPDEPAWWLGAIPTSDGRYLVISAWESFRNAYFVLDLEGDGEIRPLIPDPDGATQFVGSRGTRFWFMTDRDAPLRRLVEINVESPGEWRDILPEGENALQDVRFVGNRFVARYLRDAYTEIRVFDLDGTDIGGVALPTIGSAYDISGRPQDTEFFFTFATFTTPESVYRHDFVSGQTTAWREPRIAFDPQRFETRQVFYRSNDGTQVPMFLSYRKDLALNGRQPVLMYGYGGFASPMTPWFSARHVAWMELGGIYAQPGIRGGGEYGSSWHADGARRNKQNSLDDFIAAAEWLIANGFTEAGRIAISGVSNGGLLVAAVLVQRPELFGAALPSLGLMDMLRYQALGNANAWVSEYGTIEDPDDFSVLRGYSPYHNLSPGTRYPATLILTGRGDTRVSPAHSYKFAAALQAAQAGGAPILLRVEPDAGHGGQSTTKLIEEQADRLTFLVSTFDLPVPQDSMTRP